MGFGISEDFRTCIEELEPGRHEFREVELQKMDGSFFGSRYYALNAQCAITDAIYWDRTTAHWREASGQRILRNPNTFLDSHVVTMKKSAIDGHDLWIQNDVSAGSCLGVSDRLYSSLVDRKLMRGIHSFPVEEV